MPLRVLASTGAEHALAHLVYASRDSDIAYFTRITVKDLSQMQFESCPFWGKLILCLKLVHEVLISPLHSSFTSSTLGLCILDLTNPKTGALALQEWDR